MAKELTTADGIPVFCAHTDIVDIGTLVPNPRNPNTHPDSQLNLLAHIIGAQGWRNPVVVSKRSGFIVKGHGRYLSARIMGVGKVPIDKQEYADEAAEWADMIADNRIAELSEIDGTAIRDLLGELDTGDIDMLLTGFDDAELARMLGSDGLGGDDDGEKAASLSERFLAPPFTVLDAKQGYWKDRKKAWLSLGIASEVGREGIGDTSNGKINFLANKGQFTNSGSVFDPVLAEVAYTWFSPVGASILDPFAGGSVRGIVAGRTGREYTGVDLRAVQVDANRAQAVSIPCDVTPAWVTGDSVNIDTLASGEYDLIFTCPPYGNLEVYSDDEGDISNMEHSAFVAAYRTIIAKSVAMLRQDRFAVIVVGDFRDKKGIYRNFVSDTIAAFQDAGASYYNEVVYCTPIGTMPLKAAKGFNASRKLGKIHQNLLVFVKGDPKVATAFCGTVEVREVADEDE